MPFYIISLISNENLFKIKSDGFDDIRGGKGSDLLLGGLTLMTQCSFDAQARSMLSAWQSGLSNVQSTIESMLSDSNLLENVRFLNFCWIICF